MGIPGLTLIGESINDSIPSTHQLFEANHISGIVDLAGFQAEKGAVYIDVNVGPRTPALMAEVVKRIQEHVSLPLSIDTPDPEIALAGLETYNEEAAGNQKPILNSISEARLEMFDLFKKQPFIPILLVTEGMDDSGEMVMNRTAEQTHSTARSMVEYARKYIQDVQNDQLILDPGILPIGSDKEGNFKRLLNAMKLIHQDDDLSGVNMSVGLSNFTTMLPVKKADGSPVKSPLESAFLTMAMPLGLNTIIGSVKRKYAILPKEDPAMQCLKDILQSEGINAIIRIMNYYSE